MSDPLLKALNELTKKAKHYKYRFFASTYINEIKRFLLFICH